MSQLFKVLFFVPYPLRKAPSQRFRVELFFPVLEKNSIPYRVESFLDASTWDILYTDASFLRKTFGVLKGFFRRLIHVFLIVPFYDYIFIHREASPIGPPVFEFIISKILRKKIIYDFDDAIWISNTSNENRMVRWFKAFWKVRYICKWSYKVAAGNRFLQDYAYQYNKKVVLLPTCVDIERQHNQVKNQNTQRIVIGWTGSHSTMKYLNYLVPVLEKIVAEFKVDIVIISNKPPTFTLPGIRYICWNEQTEIQDLLNLNIGLMPLEDDAWSDGKCGFKLIQYMALGIPAIATPVGVNKIIIDEGINGFLCAAEGQWYSALLKLIHDSQLRKVMGKKGREKIINNYSLQSNSDTFLSLFT